MLNPRFNHILMFPRLKSMTLFLVIGCQIPRGYVTYFLKINWLWYWFGCNEITFKDEIASPYSKEILLLEICSVQYVFTVWLLMYFVHNVSNSWMLKLICRMQKPKNWRLACQTTVGTPDSTGLVRVSVCISIYSIIQQFFVSTKLNWNVWYLMQVVIQQLPEWKGHEWKYEKIPTSELPQWQFIVSY